MKRWEPGHAVSLGSRATRFGGVLVLVALCAVVVGCDRVATTASAAPAAGTPLAVSTREFVHVIRLTGLTEAVTSYTVVTPVLSGSTRGSLTIVHLARPGTAVKKGDELVEFDRQDQEKTAFEKDVEWRDLSEQILRKRAEQDAAKVKDESELAQAQHAVDSTQLETLNNNWVGKIKAEQNLQALEEAKAKLAMLRQSFPLKRSAAAADLRLLEIKRDRAASAREHARANAAAMTVRSPIEGLVVPKMAWKGNGIGDVQEGDDRWPGSPVLEVVSQASMQVRAKVNQADAAAIRTGQPVTVRLDAYPDIELHGRILQMGPIAAPGSFSPRVRSFTAVVGIDGSHARVLPDLSAAVDVEVERVHNALVVPRSSIHEADGRASVSVGGSERTVTLGPRDAMSVVITEGLRAGDEVLP
jgi:HlyD family secretion protein